MSIRRSLSEEASFVFIGQASTAIAHFAVGMILVRHFSDKDVFATYSQAMFLAQTLVAFTPLALHRAIIYFFPRVESQRAFAIQTMALISVTMLLAGAVMLMLAGSIGAWFTNPTLAEVVPLVFGLMWVMNFGSILSQVLLAIERSDLLGVVTMMFSTLYLSTLSTGVYFNLGVIGILELIVILYGIQGVATVLFTFRLPGQVGRIKDFSHITAQLKYCLPLALGSFTGILGKTMDRFIIMYLFRPAVFAVYDRGAIEVPFVSQLPYSANAVLQPRLTALYKEGKIDEFLAVWHSVVRKLTLVMIPIMVLCWVVAEQLIIIVNTDAYLQASVYLRIYLLLIPIQITIYPAILMASGRTASIFWITVGSLVLNLFVNILLVKVFQMGPVGPAVATVAVETVKGFGYLWMIGRSIGIGLRHIYPWWVLLRISAIAIISGLVVYPVTLFEMTEIVLVAVGVCIYTSLYVIGCLASGVIEWREVVENRFFATIRRRRGVA